MVIYGYSGNNMVYWDSNLYNGNGSWGSQGFSSNSNEYYFSQMNGVALYVNSTLSKYK